ncbi:MAG: DNA primase [Actinomycetota bacterium]
MGIHDDDIVRVREATDIGDLVGAHLQLRRVGRRMVGLCPFHNEKTPSFNVNTELGFYKCFGCGKSGDAITFVREIEHLDFVGAVEFLANKAGIQLRYTNENEGAQRRKRTELTDAVEAAVEWYHQRLLSSPDARQARGYLRSRGLDGDQVRHWKIGWAPDDWDQLFRALKIKQETFVGAGLGFVNKANRVQDHFRARVLFPIHDVNGVAVGFGGRVMPNGDGPKYKNSFDSPIYAKSRLLYGLHMAKDEIVRKDESIVCEGYTDVLGFADIGIERSVATCGTALTEDHIRMLKRFGRRIVLAFDADAAGQAAAERIYEWEQALEVDVAVARMPDGIDPADYAAADPDGLRAAIEGAQPFLGFRLQRVLDAGDLSTPEGRARTAQRAVGVVREHPVDLVRDQYLMQVADACGVDTARLRTMSEAPAPMVEERRWVSNEPTYEEPVYRFEPIPPSTERTMLLLCLHRPAEVRDWVEPHMFGDPRLRSVFTALLDAPSDDLFEMIESVGPELGDAIGYLAALDEPDDDPTQVMGHFLHDAGLRRVGELQREAQRTGDPALMPVIADIRLLIPQIRESSFDLTVAEGLVPLLSTQGAS